jgi:hypothetical protein
VSICFSSFLLLTPNASIKGWCRTFCRTNSDNSLLLIKNLLTYLPRKAAYRGGPPLNRHIARTSLNCWLGRFLSRVVIHSSFPRELTLLRFLFFALSFICLSRKEEQTAYCVTGGCRCWSSCFSPTFATSYHPATSLSKPAKCLDQYPQSSSPGALSTNRRRSWCSPYIQSGPIGRPYLRKQTLFA